MKSGQLSDCCGGVERRTTFAPPRIEALLCRSAARSEGSGACAAAAARLWQRAVTRAQPGTASGLLRFKVAFACQHLVTLTSR